jgi:uncharacterized membrane protein YcaP (DUF421 family)
MFHEIWMGMRDFVGIGTEQLAWWEMMVRAAIIYLTAVVIVRLGDKRFMGKNTAFDVILGIILGSVLSRAITGNAPFFPTIAAAAVLMAVHWLFAITSFHLSAFGGFVKGRERVLIRDGEIQWDAMRKSHITQNDLEEALYTSGGGSDTSDVKIARLERGGTISVVPKEKEPRVVTVKVEQGVQTIRIEM